MKAELGIWPVRVEADKLGEALAQRLGGELVRPWRHLGAAAGEPSQEARSPEAEFREALSERTLDRKSVV